MAGSDATPTTWSTLESAPKALVVIAAAMLSISVYYDFSYFRALGLSFSEVPTSLQDHIRSALVWAPASLAGMFVGGMISLWIVSRPDPLPPWLSTVLRWLLPFMLAVGTAGALWSGAWTLVVYFLTAAAWMRISDAAIGHRPFRLAIFGQTLRFAPLFLFIVLPLQTFLLGALGYGTAWWAMEHPSPRWQLIIKTEASREARVFAEVRRFSTVTIAVGLNRDVHVFPAEAVVEAISFSRARPVAGRPPAQPPALTAPRASGP